MARKIKRSVATSFSSWKNIVAIWALAHNHKLSAKAKYFQILFHDLKVVAIEKKLQLNYLFKIIPLNLYTALNRIYMAHHLQPSEQL
jgi:hypothetical protein